MLFATADWSERYWTNKQHTARTLVACGWRVIFVESVGLRMPDARSATDWRRMARRAFSGVQNLLRGPREAEPSLWIYSPLVIPFKKNWRIVAAINRALLEWPLRRFARSKRFIRPMIWTYHPFMLGVPARVDAGPLVYHCVDDLSAVPGIDGVEFNFAERELLRRADVVFVTSKPLYEKCVMINPNSHFFSNVADVDHLGGSSGALTVSDDVERIPRPRLGYHGVLSDFKVDFKLLLAVAIRQPSWHIVLVGDEREGQSDPIVETLRRCANVHFLGYRPYSELPAYLRGIDVGLLPICINDYTRSMFPMKFYEYLSAGIPVVSTPVAFATENLPRLLIGGDVDEFIAAIQTQLSAGKLENEQARRSVGEHTWHERMASMLAVVAEAESAGQRKSG